MRKLLLGTTLILSFAAPTAFAKTITADFSVANQSLFGSGGTAAFNGSVGVGSNSSTFQFKAATGASSGTVSSNAQVVVESDFATSQDIGTGTVKLSFGGAKASFNTALGAFIDVGATVRTPTLGPIPSASIPITLLDEDYQLNASASDVTYGLGQTISGSDSVDLPGVGAGVGITVSANPNVDQESELKIEGLDATLLAVNQTTGTMLSQSFFFDGGMLGIDFDFDEAGVWDLSLANLELDSMFDSVFGLSATFAGGVSVGAGCGNPATNSDNGFFCAFDEGLSATTPTVNLLSTSPFSLDYNTIASIGLGSITVNAAPSAVPLPASLPLLVGAFGLLGWGARRRKALAA